jgi:hypothetical protein
MSKPVTSSGISNRFMELIYEGKIDFDDQVKIFNQLKDMFGLRKLSNQANDESITPAGVLKSKREYNDIDGVKFYYNCE